MPSYICPECKRKVNVTVYAGAWHFISAKQVCPQCFEDHVGIKRSE